MIATLLLNTLSPTQFQQELLQWFDQYGRKDLPWQNNKSAYRVWVSEIMLQQTQVSTVIDYFQRFIARFPDVSTLANAHEDEVLHLWTGLGYYQRARNLHKTAKIIDSRYQGHFPTESTELETLPGVGKSTAGAIAAIAFAKPAAILDGNVKRVLTRLHGITDWPGDKKITNTLWTIAEHYTPQARVADYTQAIMDLGATLCSRGKPVCQQCPFQQHCRAHQQDMATKIPTPKPKKTLPVRTATLFILFKKPHFVLLEKRHAAGVWKGLWSLPEATNNNDIESIRQLCLARFQLPIEKVTLGKSFRHTFSHYHLDILPAIITLKPAPSKIMADQHQIWYNLQQPQSLGLPAPVKLLLSRIEITP